MASSFNKAVPMDTPTHTRSRSDSTITHLSPSPSFKEPPPKVRDDNVIIVTPSKFPSRAKREALVLQMPPPDPGGIFQPQMSGRNTPTYSPQTERENFESPTSVLPRHSRGLDFSRACTNLHHSTLPDQATPDSSPKVSHRSLKIPSRRQSVVSNINVESPRVGNNTAGFRPRSLGSTTAMTSDASEDASDSDEDMQSRYDPDEMLATPTSQKHHTVGAFTPSTSSRGENIRGGSVHHPSPDSRRFQPYRRVPRVGRGRGGRLAVLKTQHQNGTDDSSSSTDANDMSTDSPARRESISSVTNNLQISTSTHGTNTSNDSDNEVSPATFRFNSPQVVRRPVTRRSDMYPKSKGFTRIRAQLQEEASPVESDVRRDAEVVRQVRIGSGSQSFFPALNQPPTGDLSPDLTPTLLKDPADVFDVNDTDGLGVTLPTTEVSSVSSPATARRDDELSRPSFKESFFQQSRINTPPLYLPFSRHRSSSGISSEDIRMDSPAATSAGGPSSAGGSTSAGLSQSTSANPLSSQRSESESEVHLFPAPSLPSAPNLPTAAEITRKANAKRRRDDDYFDPTNIKRRAVSPGMSVHSSPVMGQSPVSSTGGWWYGPSKEKRESSSHSLGTSANGSGTPNGNQAELGKNGRSMSMGSSSGAANGNVSLMAPPSTPNLGARRVGLQQGMSDTNDGFVKMTLD